MAETQTDAYTMMQEYAKKKQNALDKISDTDYNQYLAYANQQKNAATLQANQQKASANQSAELARQKYAELFANSGVGGATYQAPRSGLAESSLLQQDLRLQDTIKAVNSEEKNALKSLQDLIDQKQTAKTTAKLTNEADYWSQMQSIASQQETERVAKAEANKNAFMGGISNATSFDDVDALARFYGVDADTQSIAKRLFANDFVATGGNLTEEEATSIYGTTTDADGNTVLSKEAEAARKKSQENNYATMNEELNGLLSVENPDNTALSAYWTKVHSAVDSKTISEESRQKLLVTSAENQIKKVDSEPRYKEVLDGIENDDYLSDTQKATLKAELKKSEYNPNSFKKGKASVSVASYSPKFVKNNDTETRKFKGAGQDMTFYIDGKLYRVECNDVMAQNTVRKNETIKNASNGAFLMFNNKLVYKYSNDVVYTVGDVIYHDDGSLKKSDLIDKLQEIAIG